MIIQMWMDLLGRLFLLRGSVLVRVAINIGVIVHDTTVSHHAFIVGLVIQIASLRTLTLGKEALRVGD